MAKVRVRTIDQATECPSPSWSDGSVETRCYFSGKNDLVHLYLDRLMLGSTMRIADPTQDRLIYVWAGEVLAGGHVLASGSSFIAEHGAQVDVVARSEEALFLSFSAGAQPSHRYEGGKVHFLPVECVPRVEGENGTSGGLHAGGSRRDCSYWLNENSLPGDMASLSREDLEKGIHAHPADEIIFVTQGSIRLGEKLYPAGTAIAIAAHTLYGFAPGPNGMNFITFRPSGTNAIRFSASVDYSESSYFQKAAERLAYLAPV